MEWFRQQGTYFIGVWWSYQINILFFVKHNLPDWSIFWFKSPSWNKQNSILSEQDILQSRKLSQRRQILGIKWQFNLDFNLNSKQQDGQRMELHSNKEGESKRIKVLQVCPQFKLWVFNGGNCLERNKDYQSIVYQSNSINTLKWKICANQLLWWID